MSGFLSVNSAYLAGALCRATRRKLSASSRNNVPNDASQSCVAFSSIEWKTGFNSPGDELMTRSTSDVAVCCSNASSRSRRSRADSLSARIILALRRFGIALRLRALLGLLLALERRRIAHPKGLGLRRFSKSITAGIYDRRNGVQGSVCTAAILSRRCPLL